MDASILFPSHLSFFLESSDLSGSGTLSILFPSCAVKLPLHFTSGDPKDFTNDSPETIFICKIKKEKKKIFSRALWQTQTSILYVKSDKKSEHVRRNFGESTYAGV